MLSAFAGHKVTEECMLLSESDGVMNSHTFMVHSSPMTIDDESYAIIHLTDITDRKNKEIMEKIFLHDLMNAVNGITCAGNLLKEKTSPETINELAGMVVDRAGLMVNEINAHRLFISAENKQLKLQYETVDARKTIDSVCTFFANSSIVKKLNITISQKVDEFKIVTDQRILYRILENLIKNALESSPEHKTITVKASRDKEFATFCISNEKTIQRTVASQIFKRSFSTKGTGRGLGTYSVKLFTENYLSGKVWFDSSEEEGTNFYVKLPLMPH
ncbi:sensor histidine kinase [Maridesulfovibrio zosterae]|uniref:sensor histidine kinase n=1 Tax=Maridesulfovibrio zosterae TaxID=82171 RepID=UPI00041880DC|nr:HAMP domain-containing sensor histidine kinase [Maridesulfovibrio zosterae]